jgi:hypothetical protein
MIDLKGIASHRWRISYDESCDLPGCTREDKLYGARLTGKHGHVFVQGREVLGAYIRLHGDRLNRLLAVPASKLMQLSDREASVSFPPEHLETVAEILKLRRRRRVSEEQLAGMLARLEKINSGKAKIRPVEGQSLSHHATLAPSVEESAVGATAVALEGDLR